MAQTKERRDLYQEITDAIVTQLENGTVPWHKPWNAESGLPLSMSTKKPYRGINVFLLAMTASAKGYTSPYWGTFNRIKELGGSVRKGEKGTTVVFWKMLRVELRPEERHGKETHKVIPMLRYFVVFNADQADGLPERFEASETDSEFSPVQEAEMIVLGWTSRPKVHTGDVAAYYRPSTDSIHMPDRESFDSPEAWYSTLFHEMTHSTGHPSRLNRPTLLESHRFGDENYSKEELVAEMGAAMLCGMSGIAQTTVPQSAAYIESWLRALRNDKKLLVAAAGQAQKAADHILGATYEEGEE